MDDRALAAWLFTQGNPILRYRTAVDLLPDTAGIDRGKLLQDALNTDEVGRWLDNLAKSRNIHGSKDTDAENALAKLLEYGLTRDVAAFDAGVKALTQAHLGIWDPFVLTPFLLRAGYVDHPFVTDWHSLRLEKLRLTAERGDYNFYLDPGQTARVPSAWRGKPVYKDEFGHAAGYSMPTCYDFYALAYCPPLDVAHLTEKRETVVAYLSDPRFQSTAGGYGWDRIKKRCYAAGRVFLACAEPARLVLFLELGAGFAAARRSAWFQTGLAALERYRTPRGTYCFPPGLLCEKSGPHLYAGSHMGLGENRRSPGVMELESTFRMLMIRKRMEHYLTRHATSCPGRAKGVRLPKEGTKPPQTQDGSRVSEDQDGPEHLLPCDVGRKSRDRG